MMRLAQWVRRALVQMAQMVLLVRALRSSRALMLARAWQRVRPSL